MRKTRILILLLLASLLVYPGMARLTRDVLQTIPPVVTSGPNAVAGCGVLNLSPGSAITGQSGFIHADCPNNVPAIILRGTETPTFILATGFTQVSLMSYTSTCSFQFVNQRLTGVNLTTSGPLTFTTQTNSTTQLLEGGYDYCLFYQNPPPTGIASFTIAWSP